MGLGAGMDEQSKPQEVPGFVDDGQPPIARLVPGSDLHRTVLDYLKKRIQFSERKMGLFYDRWRVQERKIQAYIDLSKYDQIFKQMTDDGKPPRVTEITVPYSWATISTIVTYGIHTFCGRKPIFQLSALNSTGANAARNMENLLQYNADATRLIKHFFQFLQDCEVYGVAVFRTAWKTKRAMRTVWTPAAAMGQGAGLMLPTGGGQYVKQRMEKTVFQGTEVFTQDPFMFFPDPRVPMCEVNRRGEFVFWRTDEGRHLLKRAESAGEIKWVDDIPKTPLTTDTTTNGDSNRSLLSRGESRPGRYGDSLMPSSDFVQIDQGTVDIIPSQLGLGASDKVEKWIFSIGNMGQIIQAEPLELDHDMHPVAVAEPYTMGYGFGQPGLSDYLGPLQDTISWFINSHITNVRTALNNMFVVDPSMVEMQDLMNPEPGKLIRLKRSAYGQDPRNAVYQLNVSDVTGSHVNDMQIISRMGDMLSSVVDNVRGLQDSGGRKTATEVRTSMEAASSRLAAHARLISAQGVVDLSEQMVLNYQQNLSEDFAIQVLGPEGDVKISPEMVVGDFTFPVNDGTLPVDKVALLDVWQQLFQTVMSNQGLAQMYDVPKLFEFVATLGGAQNIAGMRLQVQPDATVEQQVHAGNMVPMSEVGGMLA